MSEEKQRDVWDKLGLVLQYGGGLLTAVVVAVFGFVGSSYLKERENAEVAFRERMQASETNVRVYTELMSRREESESALRKDMFVSMLQTFLKPASTSLDERVLNLELLSYNFHESLNLKPLFIHIDREIRECRDPRKSEYLERLHKVVTDVARKQMVVLEQAGRRFDRFVDLEALKQSPGGVALDEGALSLEGVTRYFQLFVQEADRETRELKLRLEIRTPSDTLGNMESNSIEFWVGFYDFPMIDNTRLTRDQRCAVVLNAFEDSGVDLTLVYFPGAYASLKEKPYYQEVVQKLMRVNALSDAEVGGK